jgi:ribosomal protein S6
VKSPAGVTVTYGSPENSLKIGVQKQKISAQQTLSQCIDYMKGHIRRTNGKVLNSGKSVINGTDAAWIRSEISGETALTYYMKKGNDIYSVIATAKGNDFNENKIYEVARSFRFE